MNSTKQERNSPVLCDPSLPWLPAAFFLCFPELIISLSEKLHRLHYHTGGTYSQVLYPPLRHALCLENEDDGKDRQGGRLRKKALPRQNTCSNPFDFYCPPRVARYLIFSYPHFNPILMLLTSSYTEHLNGQGQPIRPHRRAHSKGQAALILVEEHPHGTFLPFQTSKLPALPRESRGFVFWRPPWMMGAGLGLAGTTNRRQHDRRLDCTICCFLTDQPDFQRQPEAEHCQYAYLAVSIGMQSINYLTCLLIQRGCVKSLRELPQMNAYGNHK